MHDIMKRYNLHTKKHRNGWFWGGKGWKHSNCLCPSFETSSQSSPRALQPNSTRPRTSQPILGGSIERASQYQLSTPLHLHLAPSQSYLLSPPLADVHNIQGHRVISLNVHSLLHCLQPNNPEAPSLTYVALRVLNMNRERHIGTVPGIWASRNVIVSNPQFSL